MNFLKKVLTSAYFCAIIINGRYQYAGVAQSVVHLIRNQKVVRSSRITSLKRSYNHCKNVFLFIKFRISHR